MITALRITLVWYSKCYLEHGCRQSEYCLEHYRIGYLMGKSISSSYRQNSGMADGLQGGARSCELTSANATSYMQLAKEVVDMYSPICARLIGPPLRVQVWGPRGRWSSEHSK